MTFHLQISFYVGRYNLTLKMLHQLYRTYVSVLHSVYNYVCISEEEDEALKCQQMFTTVQYMALCV
jgi:hypothetical protein